jgi:hypothetical protein
VVCALDAIVGYRTMTVDDDDDGFLDDVRNDRLFVGITIRS